MSPSYKMSNETWIWSGVFGCRWVCLPQLTLCDSTCSTAGVPVFQQSSGRALTANPFAPPALSGWNATRARPRWCWLENGGGVKARIFIPFLHARTCATIKSVLLSDCWVSPDNQMQGDTPFTLLGNILSKSLTTVLYMFVTSGEIFLTKFRYLLYGGLF